MQARTLPRAAVLTSLVALAAAGTLWSGSARAGDVNWSIGIHAPLQPGVSVGTVISGGPSYGYGYRAAPAPIYYAPAGYADPYAYYAPPTYYAAPPVYVVPRYPSRHQPRHHRDWQRRDRDRDGIPDRYDRRDDRRYPVPYSYSAPYRR